MVQYEVPVYKCWILFTRSRAEFSQQAEAWGAYEDTTGADGMVLESDQGNFLVGVFTKTPGTLAHEMAHASLSIIKNAGFDAEAGNQEPFCYLLGHLVDHFAKVK